MSTKLDIAAITAKAQLRQSTVELCLRGDLQARKERLEFDLLEAKSNADAGSFTGSTEVNDLIEQLDKVREQIKAEGTHTFHLAALSANDYDELMSQEQYQPVDGKRPQEAWLALLAACLFDPDVPKDRKDVTFTRQLADVVTDGQLKELIETAIDINQDSDLPF